MYCYYARIGGGGGTAAVSRLLIVSRTIRRRREFDLLSSPSSSLSIFSLFDGSTFPKNTTSLAVAAFSSSSSSLTGNSVQHHQLHQDDDDDDHNDGNDGNDRKVVSAARSSTNINNTNISSIIKQVRTDLIEADVNHDGYVDYEELKLILSKYPNTFCPQDIDRIGNLFWVGRSGNSVRHSTFLKGIQHIMRNNNNTNNDDDITNGNNQHYKQNHPLRMTSLEDNRCWISPQEAKEEQGGGDFYNVQNQFDQSLSDYVQEVTTTTTTTTTTDTATTKDKSE